MRLVNTHARAELLFFIASSIILFGGMLFFHELDPDLFARLAVGRLIDLTGEVPKRDTFAFTPVKEVWYDHEWLAGLVFYRALELGGQWALLAVNFSSALLTVLCLRRAQRILESAAGELAWAWLGLSLFLAASIWTSPVRSHIFTYLGLSITFLVWLTARQSGQYRVLLTLPLVYLVWGNAHGGVVTGFGFLAVASVCALRESPRLAAWGALVLSASVASLFVNPYGAGFPMFLLRAVSMERSMITEWWAPRLLDPANTLLWIYLVVACVGSFVPRSRVLLEGRVYLILSAYQALQHERLVPVFALTSAVFSLPVFIDLTTFLYARWPVRMSVWGISGRIVSTGFSLCAFLYVLVTFLMSPAGWGYSAHSYPERAITWLKQHYSGGKVMVGFNYGSFALWRLPRSFKISIDGRYEEVYAEEVFSKAYRAYQVGTPGQEDAVQWLNPDFILYSVGTPEEGFEAQLQSQFIQRYSDGVHAILVRKSLGEPNASGARDVVESPLRPGF